MLSFVKRHPWMIVFCLLFGLFVFLFVLPGRVTMRYRPVIWKVLPKYRYSMSHSLIYKINGEQMKYKEAREELGSPDFHEEGSFLMYHLRNTSLLGVHSDWLEIHFTDSTTLARIGHMD